MSVDETTLSPPPGDGLHADERYVVRDPLQVRALLQALVDQRSTVSVHPDGCGQPFPSAVLELGEDSVLLDGSPVSAFNRRAAGAGFLLCFAQVDRVQVRFRAERPRQQERDGYVAFLAALPRELNHLQRRELYRLTTSLDDAPWVCVPDPAGGEALRWRAADISAGGIALLLPTDQKVFALDQRCTGCVLELPDAAAVTLSLRVRNLVGLRRADGTEQLRVGMRFEDLPRGADAAIQRHIFNVERRRNARMSGNG
jgi:c-di-GMP-binding flagellar brake protein YcgR